MPASDTTRGFYRYDWLPNNRDERGDAIWRWYTYVCPAGWTTYEPAGVFATEEEAQESLAAQGIPATEEAKRTAAIWCSVPYDYDALQRQLAEERYWQTVATTPYKALGDYRHAVSDHEPDDTAVPLCSVCGVKRIDPHAAKYRGVTRCKSCAAKARGMDPEHQRQAGKARAAQLAEERRLADLARAAGLS